MPDTENHYSELYSAYAAGALDPAFALMLETQAVLRGDVRLDVLLSETIAAAMLETEASAPMAPDATRCALDRIEALEMAGEVPRKVSKRVNASLTELLELPDPLCEQALIAAGQRGWQQLGIGVRRLPLDVGSELEVELYRMQPGARVARHSHSGHEFTLVVSGGFTDETGNYGPGDISVKGPNNTHQPVADPDEPCFALGVRDAGLKFSGAIGLIQRVMGR